MATHTLTGSTIQGQYIIQNKIGNGAFGEVYLGKDIKSNMEVAIKLEQISKRKHRLQLFNEAKIYKLLQGNKGIPDIYWSGTLGDYNIMVIKSLGPSLEYLVNKVYKSFSLKTTLYIAEQMISSIELFHKNGIIHRDIKPDNFLIGKEKSNEDTVYIIDYGLSKYYKNPETKSHIPYRKGKKLAGTARYCSIFTHLGIEQSRRDDLEGLIYNMIYLHKGELPWMGLNSLKKEEKYALILKNKQEINANTLCCGITELGNLLTYARSLKFEEKPDYKLFRSTIIGLIKKYKFDVVPIYDWSTTSEKGNTSVLQNDNSMIKEDESHLKEGEPNKEEDAKIEVIERKKSISLPEVPSENLSDDIPYERPLPLFIKIPSLLTHSNGRHMKRKRFSRRQDRIQTCFFKNTISTLNNELSNYSADKMLH